jgi:hypothetical protein
MANANPPPLPAPLAKPDEDTFLALLPVITQAARIRFRGLRCPNLKEDVICETRALAWAWYCRLVARGRNPAMFAVTFARLAALAVGAGRRLAGQERARDVLSWVCQRRGDGFRVTSLPALEATLADALADNTQSPVPVQVQFRTDFAVWSGRLASRHQQIIEQLALGHGATEVAAHFGVSSARISQMRGEFRRSYLNFLNGSAAS